MTSIVVTCPCPCHSPLTTELSLLVAALILLWEILDIAVGNFGGFLSCTSISPTYLFRVTSLILDTSQNKTIFLNLDTDQQVSSHIPSAQCAGAGCHYVSNTWLLVLSLLCTHSILVADGGGGGNKPRSHIEYLDIYCLSI